MVQLVPLGTGNAFTTPGRYWSGFLLDGRILLDCPPTALPHLKRLGVPPQQVEAIFITHFHGDHFVGYPFLVLEYAYLSDRERDLEVVVPPGGGPFLEGFLDQVFPDLSRHEANYRRLYVEARPGTLQVAGGVRFWSVPMEHARGKLQAFGYRLELPGLTVAYSGDTEWSPSLLELARGADVLIVDCTYATRGPEHMGLEDVRLLRSCLSPRTLLLLTHLGDDEVRASGLPNTMVLRDLETYSFSRVGG
ncbi:MAG: MBL fold metallo-hydrolase [Dehalococcoidia bacterium]|jgi:ribonuclease BN (tRNA processing enzyme)|nr:MBL fold metallo-hydrolase [Dehalococcoidia bacterium]MDW8009096.1 MBL fold metallo-hydrolase [Chloroflexota bacterium]